MPVTMAALTLSAAIGAACDAASSGARPGQEPGEPAATGGLTRPGEGGAREPAGTHGAATTGAAAPGLGEAGGGEGGGDSSGPAQDDPPPARPRDPILDHPAYVDAASAAGIDAPHGVIPTSFGAGQAWADYDGDGWLDLFVAGGAEPDVLYRNRGDGTFARVEPSPTAGTMSLTAGATWADYDNDGWPDLYVVSRFANGLFRNRGDGTFDRMGAAAGVDDAHPSVGAAWGDFDGDGDLDLHVANSLFEPDTLYRNEGDGTFRDVTALVASPPVQTFASVWLDYDDDRDPDLYVVNDKHAGNRLWRNDGPGCGGWCFTEVAAALGAAAEVDGMGVAVGDYDGDLDLDIAFSDTMHIHLLENLGAARAFAAVGPGAGVDAPAMAWGMAFFDFDNDGWLDLYVASSSTAPHRPNRLFRNQGDGSFLDVSWLCGCDDPGHTLGAVYADYDHDGAVDLALGNSGERHVLYRNENLYPSRHWLTVDLRGAGPVNRDAVGARAYLLTSGGRTLMQEVKIGSSLGGNNMRRLHFGLGDETPAQLTVVWPDGTVSEHPDPPVDGRASYAHPSAE